MGRKRKQSKTGEKSWHLVDARGQILGRLATRVATILMGKHKVDYVPYLDKGDNVVVVNAREILLTGRKSKQKTYTFYSGYPGGLKTVDFAELKEKKPEEVIRHAVSGMLPKNKLAREMIRKLYIYPEEEHPYKNQFSTKSGSES